MSNQIQNTIVPDARDVVTAKIQETRAEALNENADTSSECSSVLNGNEHSVGKHLRGAGRSLYPCTAVHPDKR